MTIIVGIIVSAVVYFSKQNAVQVGGTIRLQTVNDDLTEVKNDLKTGLKDILDKLDEITRRLDGHDWRIAQLEKELDNIREKKIGVLEMELYELRNHKVRLKYLEDEISSLKRQRVDRERSEYRNGGEKAPI